MGGSPAKDDQREDALRAAQGCGGVGITHRVGFTKSSAKGTERFLFQPVGLPEFQNVWRQPEPDILERRQRGGVPERATSHNARRYAMLPGRPPRQSVADGFRRGPARLGLPAEAASAQAGAAYVGITINARFIFSRIPPACRVVCGAGR